MCNARIRGSITMQSKYPASVIGAALLLCSAGVVAQSTTYYGYDALGRLAVRDTRGNGIAGDAAHYDHDKASNRSKFSTDTTVREGILPAGASLGVGDSIVTTGEGYRFVLQRDGNLVLYGLPTQPVWATMTFQPNGAHLDMQADGNLVLYSSNQALWNSQTAGNPGSFLAVQPDGNIVIYTPSGRPIWTRFGL
jgi:hypothetical protein